MHFDIRSHLVGAHPKLELTTWAQSDDILHSYVNRFLKTRVANLMRSRGITDEGEYRSAAQAVFSVVLHLLELDAGDGSAIVPWPICSSTILAEHPAKYPSLDFSGIFSPISSGSQSALPSL